MSRDGWTAAPTSSTYEPFMTNSIHDDPDAPGLSRRLPARPRPKRRDAVEMPDFDWLSRYYLRIVRPEITARMLAAAPGMGRLRWQAELEYLDAGIEEQDERILWSGLKERLPVDEWARLREAWIRRCKRRATAEAASGNG